MTKLEQLRAAADRKDLSALLGYKPKSLAYLVYKKPTATKYFSFQIQKRSGGVRTINAPAADLKALQARVSDLLQDCISDINDGRKISGSISHGFRRKRSIITSGRSHRGKRWVFNLDLADFFDTINLGRVMGFLVKNNNFQLQPEVATTIAQIANRPISGSKEMNLINFGMAEFFDAVQHRGVFYARTDPHVGG